MCRASRATRARATLAAASRVSLSNAASPPLTPTSCHHTGMAPRTAANGAALSRAPVRSSAKSRSTPARAPWIVFASVIAVPTRFCQSRSERSKTGSHDREPPTRAHGPEAHLSRTRDGHDRAARRLERGGCGGGNAGRGMAGRCPLFRYGAALWIWSQRETARPVSPDEARPGVHDFNQGWPDRAGYWVL